MSAEQHESTFGEPRRLPKLADRRQDHKSDSTVSSRAVSLEIAIRENLALEEYLDSTAAGESIEQSLRRLLSIRTVVSTASSFAKRQQAAIGTTAAFREIGTGSIGKVFEHPGSVWVYKLPLTDDVFKLWNNYIMNRRIENSFEQLGPLAGQVEIPRAAWYAKASTAEFWDANIDRFPFTDMFPRQRRDILCTERIFPLPKPTRDRLVDLFCHEKGRESAKNNTANQDCLVRPLLGRSRQSSASKLNIFSLRNFKLHYDQIKAIDLDAHDLAFAMADALAVLHWHTNIDAMDIEFVLGSSPQNDQNDRRRIPIEKLMTATLPTSTFEYVTNSDPNFAERVTSLWLLDFDACTDISIDEAGVQKACKAFVETDAYYPRPHSSDNSAQQLWISFGNRYITTSKKLLDKSHQDLPAKFLHGITKSLDRQTIPRSVTGPAVYQPRAEPRQHTEGESRSRDQSSSSSKPATYRPSGSVRGTKDSGPAGPAGFDHGGAGRARGDSGDTGSQRGSHYGGRGVYRGGHRGGGRGGHRGAGSRGGDDGRRSSGPFAD